MRGAIDVRALAFWDAAKQVFDSAQSPAEQWLLLLHVHGYLDSIPDEKARALQVDGARKQVSRRVALALEKWERKRAAGTPEASE